VSGTQNPYLSEPALIKEIREETHDTKTYTLVMKSAARQRIFTFQPGQFGIISILGVGEAPFSYSSSPKVRTSFSHTIRHMGSLTNAMEKLREEDVVGVRGPYGKGWPIAKAETKNVLIVAGGLGLPPLRPVIAEIIDRRSAFRAVELLYGARTPGDLLYTREYKSWEKAGIDILLTVDQVPPGVSWSGDVGFVIKLLDGMKTQPGDAIVFACGPEVMMKTVADGLSDRGFKADTIYLSLERVMKCGIGKCGRCMIGGRYVCRDGPVFSLEDLKSRLEGLL
jgi:sulfhydrogenase subunit gamma (sulfur reductase)